MPRREQMQPIALTRRALPQSGRGWLFGRSPFLIEPIHGGLDPFLHPRLDPVHERRHQLLYSHRIGLSKFTQHVVCQVATMASRRRPNADTQSRVILMAQSAFYALQAVVSRRAAPRAEAERAQRQRRLVQHYEQVALRRPAGTS